ncbi:helix-turn-helix transcriptional regulator [Phascolarctobacterium succinatutens]
MATEEKLALVREVIKRTRKCKDMTQSDLAKAVSVATATIGFWESGVIKSIRKVNRNAVAEALGIDKRLLSYNPDSTALQQSYLEKFANSKENFDLQPLPDLLVVTGSGPNRTYYSSGSAHDVMGYINSLQERVQALEDKLQRIEKAFKGDKEDGNH